MHWDLLKIFYYRRKVLGRVTLFEKQQESEDLKEWLVKPVVHLEREIKEIIRRNRKKLKKI